jgi:serine/threonine protein kinase
MSDYDLNKVERQEKYKDYYVLCEKCNKEINKKDYKCNNCYNKENDPNERFRMRLGSCKECHQVNKNSIGCLSCIIGHFKKDFDEWTSGNEVINKLIRDNHLSFNNYNDLLEWIPYSQLKNCEYIAEGGFSKVYSAIWMDGQIKKWNPLSNNWERNGQTKIALKVLNNSKNISEDFLNEVRNLKNMKILRSFYYYIINCYLFLQIKVFINANCYPGIMKCFGITQEPDTHNYALVLEYMESGDLRKYLNKNFNSITLEQKLIIIKYICYGLYIIHDKKLIHKDLHPGNIFVGSMCAYIGDFGFCMPANENVKNSIYGIIPYMAPEILRSKSHTQKSDVYSLGIIMNEIITIVPPFNDQQHDYYLALDICLGLRPNIRTEIPKSLNPLKELIEKCWDANPENRPTSKEIYDIYSDFFNNYTNKKQAEEELKNSSHKFNESINMAINSSITMETHSQAIYKSRNLDLPLNLPEPTNYSNQQEFVSSRMPQSAQTGKSISMYFIVYSK